MKFACLLAGLLLACLLWLGLPARAQKVPEPDISNLAYGPHERQVLDLWKAAAGKPARVLMYLHGGGYRAGDKSMVRKSGLIAPARAAGVTVVSINYRFRPTPIQDILRDCGRAVQFVRSEAHTFGIDPDHVALYGGSAGATASLWLAFHDDLREASAADPVLRQSSKPSCVVANECQFSLDLSSWRAEFGDAVDFLDREKTNGADFYGKPVEVLQRTDAGRALLRDCHLPAWVDAKDPPVFLSSHTKGGMARDYNQLVHHPRHVQLLQEACRNVGVIAIADAPELKLKPSADEPKDASDFLVKYLISN